MLMKAVLKVEGVSKSFGSKKIIEDFSFSVKEKEVLGVIGKSGSGKSVLIKMIIGFYTPDSGKIINYSGKRIGFSMQNNSLYGDLTVKQNFNYFASINHVSRKISSPRILELIKDLKLEEYENDLVKNLSGGTKKRVDIGCAILDDPDIVVLDEPFAGLDPELVKSLSYFIKELNNKGKTFIISSHRYEEIKLFDRMIEVKRK